MALQAPPKMAHLLNTSLAILSSIFIPIIGKSTFVFWRTSAGITDWISFWPGTLSWGCCPSLGVQVQVHRASAIDSLTSCKLIQEWQLRQSCQWQWTEAYQLLGLGTDSHNRPGQAGDSAKSQSFSWPLCDSKPVSRGMRFLKQYNKF